jgi:hypothetical protein
MEYKIIDKSVRLQPSLPSDRPGSLVGGVRSWEELPKLESCFSWSSGLGLRLKKLMIFPDVVLLPGLGKVGDDVVASDDIGEVSSIAS